MPDYYVPGIGPLQKVTCKKIREHIMPNKQLRVYYENILIFNGFVTSHGFTNIEYGNFRTFKVENGKFYVCDHFAVKARKAKKERQYTNIRLTQRDLNKQFKKLKVGDMRLIDIECNKEHLVFLPAIRVESGLVFINLKEQDVSYYYKNVMITKNGIEFGKIHSYQRYRGINYLPGEIEI